VIEAEFGSGHRQSMSHPYLLRGSSIPATIAALALSSCSIILSTSSMLCDKFASLRSLPKASWREFIAVHHPPLEPLVILFGVFLMVSRSPFLVNQLPPTDTCAEVLVAKVEHRWLAQPLWCSANLEILVLIDGCSTW